MASEVKPGEWVHFGPGSQGITGKTSCQWHYMPGYAGEEEEKRDYDRGFHAVIQIDGAGLDSASVVCMLPKADPNWKANAAMIAAAPDLLAACKKYIVYRNGDDLCIDDIALEMRAAISKAEVQP